ncbi:MAG: hypothetical protein WC107_06080 [Patescibacteria group bacterium]
MSEAEKFETWAVVEVMGHSRYAGLVREQAVGGAAFIRVDVPQLGDRMAYTKLLGAGSIFCITPVSEEVARNVAAQCYERPVTVYAPSVQPQLSNDREDFEDDEP